MNESPYMRIYWNSNVLTLEMNAPVILPEYASAAYLPALVSKKINDWL